MKTLPGILLIALVLSSGVATPQIEGVTLLSRVDPDDDYRSVWGYVAPDGREYAILACNDGTRIYNATDPRAPFEVFHVPGGPSQRVCTYGEHIYVSEWFTSGLQIVDMTSPDSPTLSAWSGVPFTHAHDISSDPDTGYLYVLASFVGTIVLDASVTPADPTHVGTMTGVVAGYIEPRDGLAYVALTHDNDLDIWDTTSFPFAALSTKPMPTNRFLHVATNDSGSVAVIVDETIGAPVRFWNVADPVSPTMAGSFAGSPMGEAHQALFVGDVCHVAYGPDGYFALDLSDPMHPVEIARYGRGGGTSMPFGEVNAVYPLQPSGNIYLALQGVGLLILSTHPIEIDHTALPSTADEGGPYTVTAVATSTSPITSMELHWRLEGGGSTTVVPMTPTGAPGEFEGVIPGQLAESRVEYRIHAENAALAQQSEPRAGVHEFLVADVDYVYATDFESGVDGWTHFAAIGADDWELGTPFGNVGAHSGTVWGDPNHAFSGDSCWGTGLAQVPTEVHAGVNDNALSSPVIPTGGEQGLRLSFRRWLTMGGSVSTWAFVSVNDQVIWSAANSEVVDEEWHAVEFDISSITDSASTVQVRFGFRTGEHYGGWNIDDVRIFSATDCLAPEQYGSGSPGTGGFVPSISAFGEPSVGSTTFGLSTTGALGGATAFLGIGFEPASIAALGLTLNVNPIAITLQTTSSGAPGVGGAGSASLPFDIPNDAGLDGVNLFYQWFIADPGSASLLVSTSPGLRARICSD